MINFLRQIQAFHAGLERDRRIQLYGAIVLTILGLIAVVAIAALNATGGSVNGLVQKVAASLSSVS